MPKVEDSEGNVIANLPYTDEGIAAAEEMKEADKSLDIGYAPGGMSDGTTRSVTQYAGGGQTGYNAIGAELIKRPMYGKGGDVKEKEDKPEVAKDDSGLFKKIGKALKNIKLTKTQVGYDAEGERVERKVPIKLKKDKKKKEKKKKEPIPYFFTGRDKKKKDTPVAEKKETAADVKKGKKAEADASWSKAVKARPKSGPSMNTLIKARGMHKKGSAKYNKIQNEINKRYGVSKRH